MNTTNAEKIFESAIKLPTPQERAAYVRGACGDNQALRQQVESLMQAHDEVGGFMPTDPGEATITIPDCPLSETEGTCIGRYKLLQKIGEGGMGVVYMAEQEEPVRRRVALKIIKLGMDTKQVVARFEAERQALALMDHPNIAKVLDGGATDTGRPYFVMELVQGVPITEFCDKNKLCAKERLQLFIPVCQAIQSAHQKGIIHRDIKPSNVLVTLHDGVPVPKVIDFGVAKATNQKLTEKTLFTNFATMIGTPAYMSPEQAEMSGLDIDTRTDIYALGVLLYALLTGTTPFPEKRLRSLGYGEMQRVILEEEPERPSLRLSTMANEQKSIVARNCGEELASLSKLLKGDLDWIVMKCLEKDRARRYETANGLAADIQRHLQQEPVSAVAPSALYLFSKYARRHRAGLAAAAAIVLVLIAGSIVSAWQALRATRAEKLAQAARSVEVAERGKALADRDRARQAENEANAQRQKATEEQQRADVEADRANRLLYAAHMNLAQEAWDKANVKRVLELLELHRPEPGQPDMRSFEWFYLDRLVHSDLLTLKGHNGNVASVAFSPDGKRLVSGSYDSTVKVWDATSGQEILTLKGPPLHAVWRVAFSPDGRWFASGDRTGGVKLWDANTYQETVALKGHSDIIFSLAFSPDGKRLASGSGKGDDSRMRIWDTTSGEEMLAVKGVIGAVWSLAFSPDGKRLAIASGMWRDRDKPGKLQILDASSGQQTLLLNGHAGIVWSARFSPDGKQIVSASWDTVKLWDATTGQMIRTLRGANGVARMEFSPDGRYLASAGYNDRVVNIWDAKTGETLLTLRGHTDDIEGLSFSPDGKRVVSGSFDRTIKIWDVTRETEALTFEGHVESVRSVAFSRDGKRLASASNDKTVKVWDTESRREMLILKGHSDKVWSVAFSPDGKQVASASHDQTVKLWDATSGQEVLTFNGHTGRVSTVTFSPDGGQVASGGEDRTVKVWNAANGQEILTFSGHSSSVNSVTFSPDGKRLASASNDRTLKVWDATTGEEFFIFPHEDVVMSVAFSADSKQLASATWNQRIKVWDATTGEALLAWNGHNGVINTVAFSPDGKRLASASGDRTVKLWDLTNGQETLTLKGHDGEVVGVAFSPDGNKVASASADQTVKLWDATPRSPENTRR